MYSAMRCVDKPAIILQNINPIISLAANYCNDWETPAVRSVTLNLANFSEVAK